LALSEGLPVNINDALNGEDSDQRKAACEAELDKMKKMNVEIPHSHNGIEVNIVGSRWVFGKSILFLIKYFFFIALRSEELIPIHYIL
jgi:hypothetical protein